MSSSSRLKAGICGQHARLKKSCRGTSDVGFCYANQKNDWRRESNPLPPAKLQALYQLK
jgi:hypothetical protein